MDANMLGDVTDVRCIREMVRRAHEKLGEIDLYTSDVGTDVSYDYARQEELTARLNLGQIEPKCPRNLKRFKETLPPEKRGQVRGERTANIFKLVKQV